MMTTARQQHQHQPQPQGLAEMIRQTFSRETILIELIKQGPGFLMACAILWGIYQSIPGMLSQIDRGYERNLTELRGIADSMDRSTTKVIMQLEEEHKRTHAMLERLLGHVRDEVNGTLEPIKEEKKY
jgi:hypothetical protein